MRIEREYRREVAELVQQRGPWAVAVFILAFAAAWLFEHVEHPGRNGPYAVLFAIEIAIAAVALWFARRRRLPPERRIAVVVGAVAAIALLVAVYHVVVDGELEVLALALVFVTLGSMVVFPWGVAGQLVVSLAGLAAYVGAVVAGVGNVTPLGANFLGLGLALGFTVVGARLAEKSHQSLLLRDAELKRTNEELERASQLKSEFLSTMSHELRTPLNVIIGYLDLLEDGAFGALAVPQKEPVQRAGRSARDLFELITATLDLSRIDAGVFSLDWRPVELPGLVGALVVGARDLPMHPGVELRWHVEPGLETLETDQRMLRLILRNLVGNALKFTEEGHVTITAERRGDGVEFAVRDTGVGIPPEDRSKIFEPFHQLDGADGGEATGVGLGLHIVRRLVSLLGGDIELESEVGEGTTFRVWLPYHRRPPVPAELRVTPSSEEAARTTP